MLRRFITLLGFAAAVGSVAMVGQGCGGDSSDDPGDSDAGGGGGGGGDDVGQPPAKPDAPATTSTDEKNFAVRTVFLGDSSRSGGASADAWKKFGYNLDRTVTTRTSGGGCKPAGEASASVKEDGENGIDNSFGANILPLVIAAQASAPSLVNQTIGNGVFTLMLNIKGLTDASQTATGLSGIVLAGADFGGKPTFTTADDWPVRPETLSNASDPKSSTIRFNDAYVVDGTFVAQADLKISLVFAGNNLDLDIKKAIVTFDHKGSTADNGTIAGVVSTAQFTEQLKKIAGNISTALCGAGLDVIVQQITEASDIMADGSAGTPDQTCNAISLALGFTAEEIAQPTRVAEPAAPGEDLCAAK